MSNLAERFDRSAEIALLGVVQPERIVVRDRFEAADERR